MNELSPHLQTDEIRNKIETRIAELRQEQYGRDASVDNHDETTILHHISVVLDNTYDDLDQYLQEHHLSNDIIADTLLTHGIIDYATAQSALSHPHAPNSTTPRPS